MKTIFFSAVLVLGGITVQAENDKHPCLALKKACEAAGFVKGEAKKGKGLYIDCLDKVAKGEPVAGVSVNSADVAACKANHEVHNDPTSSK